MPFRREREPARVSSLRRLQQRRVTAGHAPLYFAGRPRGCQVEKTKYLVEEVERDYLASVLRETRGRVGETAKRAGIDARSLYDKMKRYGIRKEDFRGTNRAGA